MAQTDPETIFEAIRANVSTYLPGAPLEALSKAYEFSRRAHQEQLRAGGDLFIVHPLSVARILSEMHLDLPTLVAGLLHDVLEDTAVTREELKSEFGEEVAHIVEGVTKIDILEHQVPEGMPSGTSRALLAQAENWRKMIVASAHDVRVILLKLADRRHNMETLEFLPSEKRRRIAEETLTLYVPLAQRFGMYRMKSILADLALKFLEPETYETLRRRLSDREGERAAALERCVRQIEAIVTPLSFPCRIYARPKSIYSIYRKMLRQDKPFAEIQDLLAVRLITDTVEHCYTLLGAIHTHFAPVPDTFTDYIAIPKNNLYQSLHTTVHLSESEMVEVQIRTERMHRIAEYGVAAHWRYKQTDLGSAREPGSGTPTGADAFEEKLDWLKQLLEWQQETDNPTEFLEEFKKEMDFDQIFVFTPKGDVKKLPAGATPVDFAYAVHTDLGHQCLGAKVNDKMVRLDHPLQSGDRCQILIRKGQHPHKDWLEFVKTARARSKIRKFFREEQKGGGSHA